MYKYCYPYDVNFTFIFSYTRVYEFRRICIIPINSTVSTFFSAPRIDGQCSFVNSTRDSLTFTWPSAKSATSYRLIDSDGVNITDDENTITVNDLIPGSYYTFAVWAVGSTGLTSNVITCINSTGVLFSSIYKRHRYSNVLFKVSC